MSSVPGAWSKAADTDIPIGHLDYSYVKDCENAKELEEIIKILRFVMFLLQGFVFEFF